jgi:hypothetical protein
MSSGIGRAARGAETLVARRCRNLREKALQANCRFGLESHQQRCEQSGPGGHGIDQDVLVRGMGAMADGAETVECRNAKYCREVAIRAATGCAFSQR